MAERVDVVIAGGGIAGSVAAAALSGLGLDILVIEPGMHADRRVGGELLHPLGVAGLGELDLLSRVEARGGARIDGFHIWDSANGNVKLTYDDAERRPAFAVDHVRLREALLEGALCRSGIFSRRGLSSRSKTARVVCACASRRRSARTRSSAGC